MSNIKTDNRELVLTGRCHCKDISFMSCSLKQKDYKKMGVIHAIAFYQVYKSLLFVIFLFYYFNEHDMKGISVQWHLTVNTGSLLSF